MKIISGKRGSGRTTRAAHIAISIILNEEKDMSVIWVVPNGLSMYHTRDAIKKIMIKDYGINEEIIQYIIEHKISFCMPLGLRGRSLKNKYIIADNFEFLPNRDELPAEELDCIVIKTK